MIGQMLDRRRTAVRKERRSSSLWRILIIQSIPSKATKIFPFIKNITGKFFA